MVIIKNIYAKQDCVIATQVETKKFKKGEYGLVKFINEPEYDNLAVLGLFIECVTPPKRIEGTVSIPNQAQPVPVIEPPVSNSIDAAPAADDVLNDGPLVEPPKVQCELCNTFMVLITNAQKEEVMYCAGCDKEYPVDTKGVSAFVDAGAETEVTGVSGGVTEVATKTKKVVYSKCPLCGKRKSANAEFCKKCQAAKDEND